ncbi:WD repeat-containing protein 70-like isoform X1 [Branchiostoma floridae x Branchiostoma belcheri]
MVQADTPNTMWVIRIHQVLCGSSGYSRGSGHSEVNRGQPSLASQKRDDSVESQDSMDEDTDMSKVMGFSSFGGTKKKARTFDLDSILEQTRKTAQERSRKVFEERAAARDSDSSDDDRMPPPAPLPHPGPQPSTSSASQKPAPDSDSDDSDSSDEAMIGPPLPPTQGGVKTEPEEEFIGPPLPPKDSDRDSDEDDEDDGEEEDPLDKRIPASHEITLEHGNKTVSALALDPSGSRLITGGYDYDLRFWDFAAMDASLQSFRTIQPCECHNIRSLAYTITGDMILIAAGNSQAKVYDRDGFEVLECSKGDQYLQDMAKTKGHVASLNCACWHPRTKGLFLTCSDDSTVRIWDVESEGKKHKTAFKARSQQGRKTGVTSCGFSRDGKLIVGGCEDGSIQIWDANLNVHTKFLQRTAHQNGAGITCVSFSYDNKALLSRGGDDTMKLWDIRSFKRPLNVATKLQCFYPMTDCTFSPDDKMVVTGTQVKKGEGNGKLVFLDRETFRTVDEIELQDTGVVRCLWHHRLNQIIVGCSNGKAKVFYDPNKSHKGAKQCVVKTKRSMKQVETVVHEQILTPHALPIFRENRRGRMAWKQLVKDRSDPVRSHRPDLPVSGAGAGGRLGATGSTLSSYISRTIAPNIIDDSNPRESILRHAKEAEENPVYLGHVYKITQPDPKLAEKTLEQEIDEQEAKEKDTTPAWKKLKLA